MKITHEDRLRWGDSARVLPPPREMFERVRCLLAALEETEDDLAIERGRSKKIAVEAAGYATEIEILKARLAGLAELHGDAVEELAEEKRNADAALASMNGQAQAQHKRIVELEAALNGTLYAESDEHDAAAEKWWRTGSRHRLAPTSVATALPVRLGPPKSQPPCKTPFQPKDIVIETEVTPKGWHTSGYLVVAGEPQEAK